MRNYPYSILTKIKSLNYLESILARDEALSKNYDDGIMFNSLGHITESSVFNIFFLNSKQVVCYRFFLNVTVGLNQTIGVESRTHSI